MFKFTVRVVFQGSETVCIGQGDTLNKAASAAIAHYNGQQLAAHPDNSTLNDEHGEPLVVLAEVFHGDDYVMFVRTTDV